MSKSDCKFKFNYTVDVFDIYSNFGENKVMNALFPYKRDKRPILRDNKSKFSKFYIIYMKSFYANIDRII